MNTVKRWYVSLYFTAMFAVSAWALWQAVVTDSTLPWLALAFTALPGALSVLIFFLGNVARTSKHIPTVQGPMWLALLATSATAENDSIILISMAAAAATLATFTGIPILAALKAMPLCWANPCLPSP